MSATLCVNYWCPRQVRGRIEHFVGRAAMDIEFLGERNIDRFVTEGLLGDVTEGHCPAMLWACTRSTSSGSSRWSDSARPR